LIATTIATFFITKKTFEVLNPSINYNKLVLVSISVLLVSMIITDYRVSEVHYLGVWTPNPIHNPTFTFSRPFSVITFLLYSLVLHQNLNKQNNYSILIIATIMGILSMWSKPSFLLSFIPAFVLVNFFIFFQNKITLKSLIISFWSILLTLIPLYIINKKVFENSDGNSGVVLSFAETWGIYSSDIILSVFIGALLPIFLLTVFLVKLKTYSEFIKIRHVLAIVNFFFAILIFLFLKETGPRSNHANFSLTYSFALFILFFMSIELLYIQRVLKTSPLLEKLGYILFILHLLSGIYYYTIIFFGYSYA